MPSGVVGHARQRGGYIHGCAMTREDKRDWAIGIVFLIIVFILGGVP
jgi:hypothetical protein